MKKVFIFIFLLVFSILWANTQWEKYENKDYRITFSYPKDTWELHTDRKTIEGVFIKDLFVVKKKDSTNMVLFHRILLKDPSEFDLKIKAFRDKSLMEKIGPQHKGLLHRPMDEKELAMYQCDRGWIMAYEYYKKTYHTNLTYFFFFLKGKELYIAEIFIGLPSKKEKETSKTIDPAEIDFATAKKIVESVRL